MSLKHLKIDSDVEDVQVDSLPGAASKLDTGLYEMIIDLAYMDTSSGGAEGMKLHLKMADGSPQTLRTAFWVTTKKATGSNTFYVTKDGKKRSLQGFIQATQVAKIACEKPLTELVEEEKYIKLWNNTAKAEENTKIRHLPELQNKPILVGVLKIRDNAVVKVGNEYEKTAKERFSNEVDKVFYPNGLSITEKNAGATTPVFKDRWVARYPSDSVIDKYEKIPGTPEGTHQPALPTGSTEGAPAASLFNRDEE